MLLPFLLRQHKVEREQHLKDEEQGVKIKYLMFEGCCCFLSACFFVFLFFIFVMRRQS